MYTSLSTRNIGAGILALVCCLGSSLSTAAVITTDTTANNPRCLNNSDLCRIDGVADTFASGQSGDTFEWLIHLPLGEQMTLTSVADPAYVGSGTQVTNTSGGGAMTLTPHIALAAADGTPLTAFATGNTLNIGSPSILSFGIQTILPTSWEGIAFQSVILQYETVLTSGSPGAVTVELTNSNMLFQEVQGTVSQVPVPAAAWLFSSGLLGLFGISRRKKAA